MLPHPHALVEHITELQCATVVRWHEQPPDNMYDGLLSTVCQQHQFNYLLWHEEDIARYAHRIVRLRDGLIESDTINEDIAVAAKLREAHNVNEDIH